MLEWADYVSQLLSSTSSFKGVTLSFNDSNEIFEVPPIIKSSILMLDKMTEHQGKFNIIVFPERIQSAFIFTLVKLLHNISEGKIDSNYDPDTFVPGEKLRFGKAVVEFLGIENQGNEKRMILRLADLDKYSAPIDFFPLFQKTNAHRLSKFKVFSASQKMAKLSFSVMNFEEKQLRLLADHKTHMDSSIVNMTSIINTKALIDGCRLCGQDLKDILLIGQTDYQGNVRNIGAGQLAGIPAVVLASDLYAIAAMAEQRHPIQSIIIDISNTNALRTQTDALDTLMRLGVPITCVTDIVNSFDLQQFQERGFNIWRWDETSITHNLYGSIPLHSDRKIKNCATRKVNYLEADGLEISTVLRLLNMHRREMQTASAQMVKVFDKLFSLTFSALRETVPIEDVQRNQVATSLNECSAVLLKEKIFLPDKMYDDLCIATDCLKKVYGGEFIFAKHQMLEKYLKGRSSGEIAIVVPEGCNKNRVQSYWQKWIWENGLKIRIQVFYPAEYYLLPSDQYDSTIVIGWLKRVIMRKILYSFNTQSYFVLLYDYEKRWRNYTTAKWNAALASSQNKKTIEQSFMSETLSISTTRFVPPVPVPEETPQDDELAEIELVLRENRYRQYIVGGAHKAANETTEAVPVNYVGGLLAFYRTGHKVISASGIIEHDDDRIEMKLPSELREGDFVVVRESDRDLVKEMADALLIRAGKAELRELSAKWKEALVIESLFYTPEEIYSKLQKAGCTRGYAAVRSWIMDDDMIAPQSKQDLEHIAAVTESGVLKEKLDLVYEAAQTVKSAHVQAGKALSLQLRHKISSALKEFGDIDPFNLWDPIEMEIEDIGLVKILKITDIGAPVLVNVADTNRLISR